MLLGQTVSHHNILEHLGGGGGHNTVHLKATLTCMLVDLAPAMIDLRHEAYVTDMAYLLRHESGAVEVLNDRHVMGLFSRVVWLELIAAAGFDPLAVHFERSSCSNPGTRRSSGRDRLQARA